ncbi:MAG: VWA domain-containing protein, partial [Gammaproteobacteria bacterium]|nr:VWA domain-containing protein [Gammaproteobacteria bacterium]
MRQNDPDNLRIPALRLFVNIIPKRMRAGVWTFSGDTSPLAPLSEVTDEWRASALGGARQIHSKGQRTDIEGALERAARNSSAKTSILLLTDGVVDVSKDELKNIESRNRILKRLHAWRADGITVNTVALSDRADHDLLEQISVRTGGWYERTNSAESLQRLFLRMFERTTDVDTVPLSGNRFDIDASVTELTMVVFRSAGGSPTRLFDPDNEEFNAQTRRSLRFRWFSEASYDLITIVRPKTGQWRIDAPEDPDNRVMVVTDLKLVSPELPSYLWPDEDLTVRASLTDKNVPITDSGFLNLVRFHGAVVSGHSRSHYVLKDAGGGEFAASLGESLTPGIHEISLRVETDTFARERRHTLTLVEPVKVLFKPTEVAGAYRISIEPNPTFVDPETLQLGVATQGRKTEPTYTADGRWHADVSNQEPGTEQAVRVEVAGRTVQGKAFSRIYGPFTATGPQLDAASRESAPAPEAIVDASNENASRPPSPVVSTQSGSSRDERKPNWFVALSVLAVVNLVLGIGALLWWRARRQSNELETIFATDLS